MWNALLNAAGAAGNAIDLPGSSVRDALAGRNPLDQWATPLTDKNRTSGRDLLRVRGLAGSKDTWGNFAGGMLTEAALDPLNFIPGMSVAKAARAKGANRAIDTANTLSMAQRADRFMPEEIVQHLHPSMLESPGVPKRILHGTRSPSDTTVLRPSIGSRHDFGTAVYGTLSPSVADDYALGARSIDDLDGVPAGNARHEMRYFDIRKPLHDGHPLPQEMLDKAHSIRGNGDWMENVESARSGGYTPLDVLTDEDSSKWQRAAKLSGYDGVLDRPGEFSQQQVAAFDPSQVYLPYIAKAIQPRQAVPKITPAMMRLAMYNAAVRTAAQSGRTK